MRKIPFLIILTLVYTVKSASANALAPDKIRNFITYLAKQGEYYRAHVELMRLKFLYPRQITEEQYHLTEDYFLFQGKRYRDIQEKEVPCAGTVLCPAHRLFRFDSLLTGMSYRDAGLITMSWQYGRNPSLDEMARRRHLMILIMQKEYKLARELANNFGGTKLNRYRELIDHSRKNLRRMRNPVGAIFLGLLPGMGYAYGGDFATGIIALLVITVNAAVTGLAFYYDNEIIGYLTGAIGICFYAGSIVGGYLSTIRHNRRVRKEAHEYLNQELALSRDRDQLYKQYGLGDDEGK